MVRCNDGIRAGGGSVIPDDLAEIVDPGRNRVGAQGIVEGRENAVVEEEAVAVVGDVGESPDDLAQGVDSKQFGAEDEQSSVDGSVGATA